MTTETQPVQTMEDQESKDRSMDPELRAMGQIARILLKFTGGDRRRMARWMFDKYYQVDQNNGQE